MSKSLLTILLLFICIAVFSQDKSALELSLAGRYDRHANYVTNFGGRTQSDTMQLYGMSYGLSLHYRRMFHNRFSIAVGAGYYRLGVSKINTTRSPFSGIAHLRPLNYIDRSSPFQPSVLYATPAYYYNTLSFSLSIEKSIPLPKNLFLDVGIGVIKHYTFSQGYQVPRKEMFSTQNKKWLGTGANVCLGLTRNFNSLYVKPAFIIPVYQKIKSDEVFLEDPKLRLTKWFGGVGLAITVGKYFK